MNTESLLGITGGRRKRSSRNLSHFSGGQVLETRTLLAGTPIQLPINDTPLANGGSAPKQFIQVGNIAFFVATDDQNGEELWKTDGTVAGTTLVKDIKPGSGSSGIQALTNINGTLYFRASEESANYELWKSDGTAEGTVKVTEIRSTSVQSFPTNLAEFDGKVLFAANNGNVGSELWVSDGTEVGTTLIKDIFPGFNGSSPGPFVNLNGVAYFAANQSNISPFDRELWRTDGTEAGTYAVVEINPGNASSSPSSLIRVNNTLYFVADNGTSGVELWKTDGTAAGSVMVKDINPTGSSSPSSLININGTLYFTANDGTNGVELWTTDGTSAGTVLVKDINSGGSSTPSSLVNLNGVLAFAADDGTNGAELWTSDGTSSGTVIVSDVQGGSTGSNPASLTVINNKVYFQASDSSSGVELWVSDGTNAGTTQVLDIQSGSSSSSPANLFNFNGTLLFQADNGTHGSELWKSDGTSGGTVIVKDLRVPQSPSNPKYLTNVNGTIFFQADDGINGVELWKTDGTVAGTTLVKDIRSGSVGASPRYLINVNGTLFFAANDGTNGLELWASDGTSAGTVLVKDIFTGSTGSSLSNFTEVNGVLYFSARNSTEGLELWRSDGTSSGTVMVTDIRSGALGSGPRYLVNVNGTLFFRASNGPTGYEVWKSDGTSSGTTLVADVAPGFYQSSSPVNLTNFNGTLFFRANDSNNNEMLYKSDGTSTGTVQLGVWGSSQGPRLLTAVNDTLYFRAADSTNGYELWKSDGTTSGTTIVRDISPGSGNSYAANLTNVNGTLYFRATDNFGRAGAELWKTDGTSVGTVQVAEITPRDVAAQVSKLQILASRNDRLYLSAAGGDGRGIELWTSDGTSGGTVRITDINSGAGSSNIAFSINFNTTTPDQRPVIVGGNLFFAADNGTGSELWILDLNLPATAVTLQNTTTTLAENTSTATAIKLADITVTDDGLGANSLSLSGADAAFFEIVGNELRLKASTVLNFEAKSAYNVTVEVNDAAVGGAVDASTNFTLTITDVNEAPTAVTLQNTNTSLAEDASTAAAIKLADIVVTDDAPGTNVLSLSGTDAAFFEIVSNELRLKSGTVLNFEAKTTYDVTVEVNDATVGGAVDASQNFTLTITDVNEAPTALSLQNTTTSLAEDASTAAAIKLAEIFVTDDAMGTNVLSLSGTDAAFFEIVGNELRLVSGTVLDFETKSSYDVTVEVNDATVGGAVDASQNFTLSLQNVLDTTADPDAFTLTFSPLEVTITHAINGGTAVQIGKFLLNAPVVLNGLAANDSVRIVGTSGNDLFAVSSAGVVVNGTVVTLNGAAARTLAGAAGSDTYRFDADDILGLYTLEEASSVSGGVDTVSFAPTTTTGIGFSLGSAAVQTVHPTNLSLRLTSTIAFENLFGGDGNDILSGNSLPNTILGNAGNDRINGAGGSDAMSGGNGDDLYVFTAATSAEADSVNEAIGGGTDTLSFETLSDGVSLFLSSGVVQPIHTNRTLLLRTRIFVENVIGGSGDDDLTGNESNNTIVGNAGNDRLHGLGGNDLHNGGTGNDTYVFSTATTAEADRVIEGTNAGIDTLTFSTITSDITLDLTLTSAQPVHLNRTLALNSRLNFENLLGGFGNDTLTGNGVSNTIFGNAGNDAINGGDGNDFLYGGLGADSLTGGVGNDSMFGGGDSDVYNFGRATALEADTVLEGENSGSDTLNFAGLTTSVVINLGSSDVQAIHTNRTLLLSSRVNFENVLGGSAGDQLIGNAASNVLVGNGGNDQITGVDGRDILIGGLGLDTLNGGAEDDILIAGRTTQDAIVTNLLDLQTEWTSASDYATRTTNLRTGVGPNLASLKAADNVLNDLGDDDSLTGGSENDWYFQALDDVITDLLSGEAVDPL